MKNTINNLTNADLNKTIRQLIREHNATAIKYTTDGIGQGYMDVNCDMASWRTLLDFIGHRSLDEVHIEFLAKDSVDVRCANWFAQYAF